MNASTLENVNLGDIVETPVGALKVCGKGWSNNLLSSVSFGSAHAPEALWTLANGFETEEARATRTWNEARATLNAAEVLVMEIYFAEKIAEGVAKLKQPKDLVRIAIARMVRDNGLTLENCGRCGGSGRYSYNQLDGDRCFGCAGKGKRAFTAEEVIERVG